MKVTKQQKVHIKKFLNYNKGKNHNLKKLHGYLCNKKYTIKDERVIKDETSPSGKIYIGIAKKPLVKVKKGFGYYGVLSQTDNRQLVQCHLCGKWMRFISSNHLKTHNTTSKQYKIKFGFNVGTGLVSDALSYEREEKFREYMLQPGVLEKHREYMAKARAAGGTRINVKNRERWIEHDNKYGYCEEQIKFKIGEYLKKYKFLPSGRSDKAYGDRLVKAMVTRYGSKNAGLKHFGFPTFVGRGGKVWLEGKNGNKLFFNYFSRNYNREKIYQWILANSPSIT